MKVESFLTAATVAVFLLSSLVNGLPSGMNFLNSLGGVQNPQPIQPALNSLISQLSTSILPSNGDLHELISTLKDTNKNLNHLFKLIDGTDQFFQNLKDYLNPPKQLHVPIQSGGGGILTSLRSTFFDKDNQIKNRHAVLLDENTSHGDVINVNQIVIASNDSLPANPAPMINVDEIRLIYQLIDMFDMAKLVGNEANRRMMLSLLERFQVPKESLLTIELLANLSKKLNENKKRMQANAAEKAALPRAEPKSIEPGQTETAENKTSPGEPEQGKQTSGKDKSMKLIQTRRNELFQRILDLKNRRKLGDQPAETTKTVVVEDPAQPAPEDAETTYSAPEASPISSPVAKRSVRALTASASENDPLNLLIKHLVSEEVVKQYKWIFDFFQQLQKIKFQ